MEHVFKQFFQEALESGGAFAVIDRKTRTIIGSSRYFGHDPEASEIEIGWTFLARAYWGGEYNGEMKRLMLDHAFKFVHRVIFLVGPENSRSRRALEKIGAAFVGRREKMDRHGKTIEVVVYEIRKPATTRPT